MTRCAVSVSIKRIKNQSNVLAALRLFKMNKILILSVATLAMTPNMASAQQSYSLDECIAEAVKNNAKIRKADGEVTVAEMKHKEVFTNFFPQISAQGGAFIAKDGLIRYDLTDEMTMAAQLLPTESLAALAGVDPNLNLVKKGVLASVTAVQPIYMGGKVVNGNRLAKVGEEVSRSQRRLTEAEVRTDVEGYFWQVVMLREKLVTLSAVEAQLSQVAADAEVAVNAGVRNRNDLLQVRLKQNDVRVSRLQVEGALSVVRSMLAQSMGVDADSVDVNYTVDYQLPENPQGIYMSPDEALSQTAEYELLSAQVEASELKCKMTTGENLPQVAIGGGYVYNNVLDGSQSNLVGGVSVSIPLSGWWGGSRAIKGKRIEVANAKVDRDDQSRLLKVRMAQAWTNVQTSYGKLSIAIESIAQSEENLRLSTDYYRAGTESMSDLLDAQTLYQQSRDSYAEALQSYEVALRNYLQATGR